VREVLEDLALETPMLRLIQGDVGSGKTVVAAFAAIRAAEHQAQTALMAPTEILAEQHYLNFSAWLEPLGITVALLTGSQSAAERRRTAHAMVSGEALVAVGTHALFQSGVTFANLALTIIDEQHRFGVHQRMALRNKGRTPHQLVMTATPIPRTLTMALYSDMAVSVIDELPKGRQPIDTRVVSDRRRDEVVKTVREVLASGRQAYWVCPLIEESELLDLAAAETTAQALTKALPGYAVGLLHGRQSGAEKARVMAEFLGGRLHLLVATTVIEVGVDVRNATLIVIENPERMGLSQLHQLRGRVGRGSDRSHCILLYKGPLGETARGRLKVIRESQDGFYIAEQDLALRGPGELLGTRQTGEQSFRIADLSRHAHLMAEVIRRGDRLLAAETPDLQEEAQALLRAWAPADTGHSSV
jgi:ATP-dependent DNA helicase RecG